MPKEKRVFGYFALPVLVGDEIVAAIDLKTDREKGKLLMQKWTWVGNGAAAAAQAPRSRRSCTASSASSSARDEGMSRSAPKCARSAARNDRCASLPLLSPIFASAAVGEVFSDRALLQAMLDFEAALAAAEAESGSSRRPRSRRSSRPATPASTTSPRSARRPALAGNVAIPLVKALTAKVNEKARGYVHWGATSQDVIDTGFVLCARRAIALMRADLAASSEALAALIEKHRGTVMAGRTLMQQALPITFGFKAAGLALRPRPRAAERLRQRRGRCARAAIRRRGRHARRARRRRREGRARARRAARAEGSRRSPGTPSAGASSISPRRSPGLSGAAAKIATDVAAPDADRSGGSLRAGGARQGRLLHPAAQAQPGRRRRDPRQPSPHRRHDGDARRSGLNRSTSAPPAPGRRNGRRCASSSCFPPAAWSGCARCLPASRSIRRGCAPISTRRSACRLPKA